MWARPLPLAHAGCTEGNISSAAGLSEVGSRLRNPVKGRPRSHWHEKDQAGAYRESPEQGARRRRGQAAPPDAQEPEAHRGGGDEPGASRPARARPPGRTDRAEGPNIGPDVGSGPSGDSGHGALRGVAGTRRLAPRCWTGPVPSRSFTTTTLYIACEPAGALRLQPQTSDRTTRMMT